MFGAEFARIASCRSLNVSCQMQWLNVATRAWIAKGFEMSCSLQSNSETSTCKDYQAFADVELPRLEGVQANDKLFKVELLQRQVTV